MVLRLIPNSLTIANLLCGCLGIVFVFSNQMEYSCYCTWIALCFDFLDGFSARLLNVSSRIGKELDSLSDMVTFGVLPSMQLFFLLEQHGFNYLNYLTFLIAVCSAIRLAKFNVSTTQTDHFMGIPTPANALFISSIPFIFFKFPELNSEYLLFVISFVCSVWLVMPLKLMALKFKNYQIKNNIIRYIFIIFCVLLILIFKILSIPIIIITYILLSLIKKI